MRKLPQTNFDEKLAIIYEQNVVRYTRNEERFLELLDEEEPRGGMPLNKFMDWGVSLLHISDQAAECLHAEDMVTLINNKLKINLHFDETHDTVRYRGEGDYEDDDFFAPGDPPRGR